MPNEMRIEIGEKTFNEAFTDCHINIQESHQIFAKYELSNSYIIYIIQT